MDESNRHRTRPIIIDALKQAASTVAAHRALVLVLRSVKYLLGILLLLCIADALFHFASGSRFGFILGAGGIVATLAVAAIAIAVFARPSLIKVAQLLEGRDSELGSKLTNVLQLEAQSKDEALDPLTRDLAHHAVVDSAQHIDPNSLPSCARFPRMKRELKWAGLPILIFAVLALLLGEPAHRQILRYVDPYGDHPPLSFTLLDISKPDQDGIEVVYGESARIEARARGHKPKELLLIATPTDGSGPPRTIPMSTRGDGSFVVTLDNITTPLTLTAKTPSKRSRSKHRLLAVLLNPKIEEAWVTVKPPAYTGLPAAEKPFRFAGVQALKGSEIEFRIRSNRPLGPGQLTAKITDAEPVTITLQPAPEGPANEVRGSFTPANSGRLTFDIRDVDQRPAEDNPSSSLTVTRDLPPRISFLSPLEDSFVIEDFAFTLQLSASDDYGLRSIRLFTGINGEYQEPRTVTFDGVGPRRHKFNKDIHLQLLGAVSGDKITFYAETMDNCPTPHLARTEMRHLEVITEEQYNDALRKETDVAEISGKYEDLLDRFRDAVDTQRELTEELDELREMAKNGPLTEQEQEDLDHLAREQEELNEYLLELADEMENFGRDNPVYDFEKELEEELKEIGEQVRRSVVQNEWDFHEAGALPEPDEPLPEPEDLDAPAEMPEEEPQPGEQQPGEQQPGEQQPGEQQPGEQQPGEAQPGEAQPGEAQPGEQQPGEQQPGEQQPGEQQPGEAQPGEQQPGEAQPGEAQPGEQQPGEAQPGEQQPGEAQPGEQQPGEAQPGEAQPGEAQPGEGQPGEGQPGAGQPGAGQPGAGQPGAGQPGAGQPGNKSQPGSGPDPEAMERAAREHLERLGGQQEKGEERVREPLQELADLHELMKDFGRFQQLFRAQRQLTDQTERFKDTEELDAADKMSLEEMAARERGVGQALDQLEDSLREHADAAEEKFPQAAESARELADAMDLASMPGLARNASRSMLQGDGHGGHNRARLLLEEMGRLFEEAGQPGMAAGEAGLDHALRLQRGMKPGNSFNQMMQSLNFGKGQMGGGGEGMAGGMATGGMEGTPKGLMGGESQLLGPIARSMRGGKGPNNKYGAPGGPTAKVDRKSGDHGPKDSTRETDTPESQALFQEYESLTDAYFRSLTNP